ncbi:helix-turn-helix transcriptional regulator [Tissierella sp. MB52-C2]|uniref:helix-turn-helix domain-containing protein n=1 Tax=Tissierella sp. MB52-C2 TaxID=3070999 RepID=UPI00280BCEFA|nr:helix-turn-helix transcriptional regulator [Tissierella sp. MB52-C2]WMM24089.1 helix-turn-helix transcriptional regulator [Tissierella sp. MB52-C2]
MSLSENLKKLRSCKGLTQEEVSKDLNMNRATYAHYETGRREPDVGTLKLLANYFNVTTDELLGEYSSISKNNSLVTESKLANRIKELRTELDLTQEEFGKIFGIVKSTVSLYESGKSTPDDEIKKAIAEYFNVSLDYLMGASNVRNPYKDNKEQQLPDSFETPEEAIKFLLEQNVIMGFGGFDVDKLDDDEKVEFANSLLEHLKLLSLKYKK